MAGYAHDMGSAEEVWRKTIKFPGAGEIIILASVQKAHLDPKEKDEPHYIAQISTSMQCEEGGGQSGYFYSKWFEDKKEAINDLFRLLYLSGEMSLQVVNFKLL